MSEYFKGFTAQLQAVALAAGVAVAGMSLAGSLSTLRAGSDICHNNPELCTGWQGDGCRGECNDQVVFCCQP